MRNHPQQNNSDKNDGDWKTPPLPICFPVNKSLRLSRSFIRPFGQHHCHWDSQTCITSQPKKLFHIKTDDFVQLWYTISWLLDSQSWYRWARVSLSWLAVIKYSIRKWQEMPLCIYILFFDFICMRIRTRSGDDLMVWRRVGWLILCSHHCIKYWGIRKIVPSNGP